MNKKGLFGLIGLAILIVLVIGGVVLFLFMKGKITANVVVNLGEEGKQAKDFADEVSSGFEVVEVEAKNQFKDLNNELVNETNSSINLS